MREGIQLYGLKGQLGNCGGCGQCVTCFVAVVDDEGSQSLSVRTPVEEAKLRRRPQDWRLACQAMVERSVMVLTRPQVRLPDAPARLKAASEAPLPPGPTAWPAPPESEEDRSEAATADEEG